MDLILTRNEFRPDGVFSVLTATDGSQVAVTLEHAYNDLVPDQKVTEWRPKLVNGAYKCVRGRHRLASMKHSFETFEITGVTGHTNILFHVGNFDSDSEGCVLLGETIAKTKPQMITHSKKTFEAFLMLQEDVQEFTLTIR